MGLILVTQLEIFKILSLQYLLNFRFVQTVLGDISVIGSMCVEILNASGTPCKQMTAVKGTDAGIAS